MGKWIHRLTEINEEERRGICQEPHNEQKGTKLDTSRETISNPTNTRKVTNRTMKTIHDEIPDMLNPEQEVDALELTELHEQEFASKYPKLAGYRSKWVNEGASVLSETHRKKITRAAKRHAKAKKVNEYAEVESRTLSTVCDRIAYLASEKSISLEEARDIVLGLTTTEEAIDPFYKLQSVAHNIARNIKNLAYERREVTMPISDVAAELGTDGRTVSRHLDEDEDDQMRLYKAMRITGAELTTKDQAEAVLEADARAAVEDWHTVSYAPRVQVVQFAHDTHLMDPAELRLIRELEHLMVRHSLDYAEEQILHSTDPRWAEWARIIRSVREELKVNIVRDGQEVEVGMTFVELAFLHYLGERYFSKGDGKNTADWDEVVEAGSAFETPRYEGDLYKQRLGDVTGKRSVSYASLAQVLNEDERVIRRLCLKLAEKSEERYSYLHRNILVSRDTLDRRVAEGIIRIREEKKNGRCQDHRYCMERHLPPHAG